MSCEAADTGRTGRGKYKEKELKRDEIREMVGLGQLICRK